MVEDVVREVWRLFRARFWRTLIIVALLLAPLELGVEIVDPDLSSDDWWLWVGISASLIVIAFPWVIGAVIHDVAVEDRTPTDAYRKTAPRLPDLMISALVTTVGIMLGTMALVVPLIVVEGAPWREALGRSNELVRGRTWSVVVIFVLLVLIGAALVAAPVLLGYFVLEGIIGAWLATLAIDTVSVAFFSFAPFVLYRRLTP